MTGRSDSSHENESKPTDPFEGIDPKQSDQQILESLGISTLSVHTDRMKYQKRLEW